MGCLAYRYSLFLRNNFWSDYSLCFNHDTNFSTELDSFVISFDAYSLLNYDYNRNHICVSKKEDLATGKLINNKVI